MARKTSSKSKKDQYGRYEKENRCAKNRTARLTRYVAKNPNDKVAAAALKVTRGVRRKKPHKSVWGPVTKAYAQVLASLGLKGNLAIAPKKKFGERDDGSSS